MSKLRGFVKRLDSLLEPLIKSFEAFRGGSRSILKFRGDLRGRFCRKYMYEEVGNGRGRITGVSREVYGERGCRFSEKEREQLKEEAIGLFIKHHLVNPMVLDRSNEEVVDRVRVIIKTYQKLYDKCQEKLDDEKTLERAARNIRGDFSGRSFDPETLEFDIVLGEGEDWCNYGLIRKKLETASSDPQYKTEGARHVDELEISSRVYCALRSMGITTTADLQYVMKDLPRVHGFGKKSKSLQEIREILTQIS